MFKIAETIGYTVSQLEENMIIGELYEWAAWFELKYETEKKIYQNYKKR